MKYESNQPNLKQKYSLIELRMISERAGKCRKQTCQPHCPIPTHQTEWLKVRTILLKWELIKGQNLQHWATNVLCSKGYVLTQCKPCIVWKCHSCTKKPTGYWIAQPPAVRPSYIPVRREEISYSPNFVLP